MSVYYERPYPSRRQSEFAEVFLDKPAGNVQLAPKVSCKVPWGLIRAVALTSIMLCILAVTYEHCVPCVVGVLVFSGLTMHCIPYMSIVFVLAAAVLIYHAIDYQKASIKVEVPLQDVIYVPTWKDLKQYIKVERAMQQRQRAT